MIFFLFGKEYFENRFKKRAKEAEHTGIILNRSYIVNLPY